MRILTRLDGRCALLAGTDGVLLARPPGWVHHGHQNDGQHQEVAQEMHRPPCLHGQREVQQLQSTTLFYTPSQPCQVITSKMQKELHAGLCQCPLRNTTNTRPHMLDIFSVCQQYIHHHVKEHGLNVVGKHVTWHCLLCDRDSPGRRWHCS